jgi:site-specific DNA recombinase
LHFYREGMVIGKGASSTDILRWDFSVMGAKSYVLNLSENVRRSLEYKRRNGEWGEAPLGYLNQRDLKNRSTLIHDPERAYLVRMLFEEYAKGCDDQCSSHKGTNHKPTCGFPHVNRRDGAR